MRLYSFMLFHVFMWAFLNSFFCLYGLRFFQMSLSFHHENFHLAMNDGIAKHDKVLMSSLVWEGSSHPYGNSKQDTVQGVNLVP